jgi:uncharacterized glyoxalase superfamily protein PhnB
LLTNRSVPTDVILPHLVYRDVPAAIAWLGWAFGFIEHYRYGSPERMGAQLHLGNAWIMVGNARADASGPASAGRWIQTLTVFVEDVEGHFERARRTGAKIVEELHETVYGERQYGVEDLEGNRWLFSRHARDVSPEEWGATIATAPHKE